MSIFKPIFVGHTLELAVMETLQIWMPTYLREVELQLGLQEGLIPAPRTYTTRNEFTTFPEDQMPICVVVSPGLAGEPYEEGNGTITAWWALGVGVLSMAATEEQTNYLSKIYAAAVRGIMVQQPSLGGICSGIEWVDESYNDIPTDVQERSIRAAQWIGRALIDNVVTRSVGPIAPPDPVNQPGSDWVIAESGSIIVQKMEED